VASAYSSLAPSAAAFSAVALAAANSRLLAAPPVAAWSLAWLIKAAASLACVRKTVLNRALSSMAAGCRGSSSSTRESCSEAASLLPASRLPRAVSMAASSSPRRTRAVSSVRVASGWSGDRRSALRACASAAVQFLSSSSRRASWTWVATRARVSSPTWVLSASGPGARSRDVTQSAVTVRAAMRASPAPAATRGTRERRRRARRPLDDDPGRRTRSEPPGALPLLELEGETSCPAATVLRAAASAARISAALANRFFRSLMRARLTMSMMGAGTPGVQRDTGGGSL